MTGKSPVFQQPANWVSNLKRSYYITTRKEKTFGVMQLEIMANYNGECAILVDSKVNPDGSRNLQP